MPKELDNQYCTTNPLSVADDVASRCIARVYIVSDVRLYREGLAYSLARSQNLEVLGAGPCRDALNEIGCLRPDVLLLDLSCSDALSFARRARQFFPALRIVALGVAEVVDAVLRCAEAGICGYVAQEGSVEDAVAGVVRAVNDEVACSPRIAAALFSRVASLSTGAAAETPNAPLTRREREISGLIARGLSNKEIARSLGLEPATIKNHVHNILQKLNVHRRVEIAKLRLDEVLPRGPSPADLVAGLRRSRRVEVADRTG